MRKFRVLSIESNFITTSRSHDVTMYEVMQVWSCWTWLKSFLLSHTLKAAAHDQRDMKGKISKVHAKYAQNALGNLGFYSILKPLAFKKGQENSVGSAR